LFAAAINDGLRVILLKQQVLVKQVHKYDQEQEHTKQFNQAAQGVARNKFVHQGWFFSELQSSFLKPAADPASSRLRFFARSIRFFFRRNCPASFPL
jgi:hypothetical protein